MRIIIVGGAGTVGSAVVKELSTRHDVLVAGRSEGDLIFDMTSPDSVRAMFKKAGTIDAIVSTAGHVHFEEFEGMTPDKYRVGLDNKLMGQVNLVLIGREFISDHGSFTLTSGILNMDPIRGSTSSAMVNGALEGFVRASAIELPRGLRINLVSPALLEESMPKLGPLFRGHNPVPASIVALAYSKSVEGLQSGQIYRVGY